MEEINMFDSYLIKLFVNGYYSTDITRLRLLRLVTHYICLHIQFTHNQSNRFPNTYIVILILF